MQTLHPSMEAITGCLNEQSVRKGEVVVLFSPKNPTPVEKVYLSNIDQTVAFPVETVFFYDAPPAGAGASTPGIVETVRRSVSEVLLIPYYFMAGRLSFNVELRRLELVCNNAGVMFAGATSSRRLKDLGDLSLPNPSFQHLILQASGFECLAETPILTIQVTRFRCGGFSIGFMTNHSILDGRSAAEMFEHLASICRGDGRRVYDLCIDRSCIRARDPPLIQFQHTEYVKPADGAAASASSFTSPFHPSPQPSALLPVGEEHKEFRSLAFTPDMIRRLKEKAATSCSSFQAVVAHLWRARTRAVFDDPERTSTVLFAVDIRSRMSPPLQERFIGNAVITASASSRVADLTERPFSHAVGMVKAAIDRVTDGYVRSVIDWLEVHKGVPAAQGGNFFVSAWWKLPFHELDFGCGKPLYGGPVASGMHEFVLLLSDAVGGGHGIKVWIALEQGRMERFLRYVFDI